MTPQPRKPLVAFLLSLLTVGLGHVYAGRARTAAVWYGVTAVALAAILVAILAVPLGVLTPFLLLGGGLGLRLWVAWDAARLARLAPKPYMLRRYNRWYVYVGVVIVATGIDSVPGLFVEAFRLPSGSMEPTMRLGDWFYATKWRTSSAARGDIIIFESPDPEWLGTTIVARAVAVGGDTIQMQRGRLFLNGIPVEESYANHGSPDADFDDARFALWQKQYTKDTVSYRATLKNWGPLVVPGHSVFVLGDNREYSKDSRYFGFVGTDRIRGRPRVVYYSYDREGDMALPLLTAIRWNRVGMRPR